ncbi:hypothetical protein QYE76_055025 [Lolium multiflorum]|uniref:Transposase (putative) gypsy type domain-containing protein n=1 Tax=Lolium multiflorum TaxID=4521 RepID=A0AAD8WLW6_LOLMU|nr:hypothetical protein QYE76_055025 [Lolium multiflorum]
MATTDLGSSEWERSKISAQDINMLKKMGFSKKENSLQFPKEESYPRPPIDYRVSFVDHLIRGLSPPIHEFLRGLLFVYGLQLHQLTPNSILHVSIFITLCECFLGVQPNWALWKRIFCLRRNGSHNVAYNIGGIVICVRSDVEYFDVKFPDSVQGWRKKWLYIHEESSNPVEENIAFDGEAKILRRRSWDVKLEDEKLAKHDDSHPRASEHSRQGTFGLSKDLPLKDFEKLIRKISSLNKKDPVPSSCRITPYSNANPLPENHPVLASLPPVPEGGEVEDRTVIDDDNQGTSRPASEVAGSHKSAASAKSEATASTHSPPPASPKNKRKRSEVKDSGTSNAEETDPSDRKAAFNPYTDALPLMKEFIRLGTQFVGYRDHSKKLEGELAEANKHANALAAKLEQSEKARRTHQDYEVDGPVGDELLDALTLLEIHGDEAREGLADAEAGLSKLFPYFFPKKEEPNTFVALAKAFNVPEDLGLKLRQEGLKIGVEGTIALIADSQQNVDWTKVGDIREMETKEWQSLIKAAKPPSKPILSFLGVKPTSTPSTSKPEVK